MSITVEATVENGQLRVKQPLALANGTTVQLTITPVPDQQDPLANVIGIGDSGRTDGPERHDRYIYGKIRP